MPNIFEKRIAAWNCKYGSLSPEVQRKIDKLVEQYDQKQQLDKNSKVFSIAEGARLIREFKVNNTQLPLFLMDMNTTGKSTKASLQ